MAITVAAGRVFRILMVSSPLMWPRRILSPATTEILRQQCVIAIHCGRSNWRRVSRRKFGAIDSSPGDYQNVTVPGYEREDVPPTIIEVRIDGEQHSRRGPTGIARL